MASTESPSAIPKRLVTRGCRTGSHLMDHPEVPAELRKLSFSKTASRPVLARADELQALDGTLCIVEGTYRKKMAQKKMNDPTLHWFGQVEIILPGSGKAAAKAGVGADALAIVLDGKREAEEVEQFEGKQVRIEGLLAASETSLAEHGLYDPRVASPLPAPTLLKATLLEDSA